MKFEDHKVVEEPKKEGAKGSLQVRPNPKPRSLNPKSRIALSPYSETLNRQPLTHLEPL